MLMMHAQLDHREGSAVPQSEVITAVKNLYIVSSAASQRGAYPSSSAALNEKNRRA